MQNYIKNQLHIKEKIIEIIAEYVITVGTNSFKKRKNEISKFIKYNLSFLSNCLKL